MIKITLLFTIFIFSCITLEAQVINSNKTTVAQFYDGQVKTIEINGAKIAGQFKLGFLSKSKPYRYTNYPEITSAKKNNTVFLNLGVTNTGNFLNLNKFDFKENNGYLIGATFQHAFSEVYLPKDTINEDPLKLRSWTVSLNYQQDKFMYYNAANNQISTAKPDQLILKGGYSRYKFNYRSNARFKYTWIPSINSQINLIDYNTNDLQNYILNTTSTSNGTVTFTNSTSFDGKYGILNNDVNSANVSISSAIVPEKSFWKLPILSPIPYAGLSTFKNNKPQWNAGIALGLLSSSLLDGDRIVKKGSNYRKFNVPSFLTIGVDWNYQDGIGSKPNYFITGSIKLN